MKTLKISATILILLGVMFSLSACSSDISGKYTFHSVTLMEIDGIDTSNFETYDAVIIELFDDDSGTVDYLGEISYIEYDDNYIWKAGYDSSKVSYTYKNDTLSIYVEESVIWVYKKN